MLSASRLYVPVYAATLLLSAFLLFAVQPMFSKMILPLMGGTPQVWNTAMLFFQTMLLAGYAYAHISSRFLNIRLQAALHLALLGAFVLVLPIGIPEGWIPSGDKAPVLWQLSLMALTVGGPFFIISGSAPMLQRWFAGTAHADADNPYFLYGASNLGSMSALIAYPFIIEPLLAISAQSTLWLQGYIALILFTALAAVLAWKTKPAALPDAKIQATNTDDGTAPHRRLRLTWLALAALPSSLMLGVTTFITTDIAAVPLLWIIPLAIYVGTFILVFARRPLLKHEHITQAFGVMMVIMIAGMMLWPEQRFLIIATHYVLFFIAALACHTELAALRPSARHLTEFYLFMSLGGALGGFFNAVIAPTFFIIPLEYALVLGLACFARYTSIPRAYTIDKRIYMGAAGFAVLCACVAFFADVPLLKPIMVFGLVTGQGFALKTRTTFAASVCIVLALYPPGHIWGHRFFENILHQDRNFFGVIKVVDVEDDQRILLHGTTSHGSQSTLPDHELDRISYYSAFSPLEDVFTILDTRRGPQKIAVLGLGIGTAACWQKEERHFNFYEIDPDIIDIAQNPEYFTFLSGCGSPYTIIEGDARLKMKDSPDEAYDLIVADAFSSDNIPVHLLTREAIELYFSKLKPGGILTFNISNNYLDIEPVLAEAAKALDLKAYADISDGGTIPGSDVEYFPAHFAVITQDEKVNAALANKGWTPAKFRSGVHLWTDQYSNIIGVLGSVTGNMRHDEIKARKKAEEEAKNATSQP